MKIKLLSVAFLLLTINSFAQGVAVNTNNTAAHASALLDVSGNRGLLIPRMDSTTRKAIASPAAGLLVMDTSYNMLFRYNNKIWCHYNNSSAQNLTPVSGTVTWDLEKGDYSLLTLTSNISLNVQNVFTGSTGIVEIKQDGTGNRQISFPANSTTSSGAAISSLALGTAPNAISIVSFIYNGSTYRWFVKN
jgi:hypothetical protein